MIQSSFKALCFCELLIYFPFQSASLRMEPDMEPRSYGISVTTLEEVDIRHSTV